MDLQEVDKSSAVVSHSPPDPEVGSPYVCEDMMTGRILWTEWQFLAGNIQMP